MKRLQCPDGYALGKCLHAGRISEVHAAVRSRDGRAVVLKAYHGDEDEDPQTTGRAQAELDALRRVAGPGIPVALDLLRGAGPPVLVLDRAPGLSLLRFVQGEDCDVSSVLEIGIQLCGALARVHAERLVHLDVHPSNVLVDPLTLGAHLIDFGSARPLGSREAGPPGSPSSLGGSALHYIAPEQTGRMDRGIDYRSDLYSLGATLYFALTGRPPFESRDALGLIHAHVAKLPAAPSELRPLVPVMLSRIVLKLLQKSQEDRYQTAHALRHDLLECRTRLLARGVIEDDWVLGSVDAPYRPLFSRTLYGRDTEIAALRELYDGVAAGRSRALLLQGGPGLGKSALVQSLRVRVAETGGYLIQGRSDRYRRDVPYLGLMQAFAMFAQQVLTESESDLARWRELLGAALGPIAGALTHFVPDLRIVLGDVPALPLVPPREARARLALAVQRLLGAIATREHPIVLLLDDLQWADADSLGLLHDLLEHPLPESLLLISAYRDGDLASEPALAALLRESQERVGPIREIALQPLDAEACARMLADALGRSPADTAVLAACVDRKTGNAPLLIQQFVDHLYLEGVIRFEAPVGWTWDDERLGAAQVPEDAVGFITAKFGRLQPAVAQVLELASCIGNTLDREVLQRLCDRPAEVEPALFALCDQGFLVPAADGLRFAHERIREAVHALLPAPRRVELHRRAARLLLEQTPASRRRARAFEIADHLNAALDGLPEEEHAEVIELNLLAGQHALALGAGRTAMRYLESARACFGGARWDDDARTGFELWIASAEAAYQTRDFASALALLDALDGRPLDRMQIARSAARRIAICSARDFGAGVLPLVLGALERLGLRWPEQPSYLRVRWAIARADWTLRGPLLEPQPLLQPIPPEWLAQALVMHAGGVGVALASPRLACLISAFMVRALRERGASLSPAIALAAYAAYRVAVLGSLRGVRRYVEAAEHWSAQGRDPQSDPVAVYLLQGFLYPWLRARRDVVEPLRAITERLRELGKLELVHQALDRRASYLCLMGEELPAVEREFAQVAEEARAQGTLWYEGRQRAMRVLQERHPDQAVLEREVREIRSSLGSSANLRMGSWPILALMLCALGRFDEVLEDAERFTRVPPGHSHRLDGLFYLGLAASARIPALRGSARCSARTLLRFAERGLRHRAGQGPDFAHMEQGLRALRASLRGPGREALALLAAAAQGAERQRYVHHAALSHERRAELLLAAGRQTEGRSALQLALAHCERWGAQFKVIRLRQRIVSLARATPSHAAH